MKIKATSIKRTPEEAEEVVIAMAIRQGCYSVLSDSRQAVTNFARGRVSLSSLKPKGVSEITQCRSFLEIATPFAVLPGTNKTVNPLIGRAVRSLYGPRNEFFQALLSHYVCSSCHGEINEKSRSVQK